MSLSDTKNFYLDKYPLIKNIKKLNVKLFLYNIYKQDPERYNYNEQYTYPLYDTTMIQLFLYHTTDITYLKSIFKYGLNTKLIINRNFSKGHYSGFEDVIFLSTLPRQYRYHPLVSDGKLRGCVLKIKTNRLDKKKIYYDQNHMWLRTNNVLMYFGDIPISLIVDVKLDIKGQRIEDIYLIIRDFEQLHEISLHNFSLIFYYRGNSLYNMLTKRDLDINKLCYIKININKWANSYDGFKFKFRRSKKLKNLDGTYSRSRDFVFSHIDKINSSKYGSSLTKTDLRDDKTINDLIWNSVISVVINKLKINTLYDKLLIFRFIKFLKIKNIRYYLK